MSTDNSEFDGIEWQEADRVWQIEAAGCTLRYAGFLLVLHHLAEGEAEVARHPGMLMHVHPRLLGQAVWLRNHSLTPKPRVNNLHNNDI